MKHYKYIAEVYEDMNGFVGKLSAEEAQQLYVAVGKHIFEGVPADKGSLISPTILMLYSLITGAYDRKVKQQDEYTKRYKNKDQ